MFGRNTFKIFTIDHQDRHIGVGSCRVGDCICGRGAIEDKDQKFIFINAEFWASMGWNGEGCKMTCPWLSREMLWPCLSY